MDTIRIAHPAHPETPGHETSNERGHALASSRFEEISSSWRRGTWHVPDSSQEELLHVVVLVPVSRCSCDEHKPGWRCEHVVAAEAVKRATAPCTGCGRRFPHRDLTEVTEDHESLTFFEGDRLCDGCLDAHGGIS